MHRRTTVQMGTIVTIDVVERPGSTGGGADRDARIDRALAWFRAVEETCSRFDPSSELRRLSSGVDAPVAVSPLLYEALKFALAVARETSGAFDPTVGRAMEQRGFNRSYDSGHVIETADADSDVSYLDVELDDERRTVTLKRPLVLDLGAVAKGLAIDMAARELQPLEHFAIDAGGDMYLGGLGPHGGAWRVGIRHPRQPDRWIEAIELSDRAMCTSGDYERGDFAETGESHILDPRAAASAKGIASATVMAPTAIVADAMATAAFVLGPVDGLRLLERHGVEGVLWSTALDRHATRGFNRE